MQFSTLEKYAQLTTSLLPPQNHPQPPHEQTSHEQTCLFDELINDGEQRIAPQKNDLEESKDKKIEKEIEEKREEKIREREKIEEKKIENEKIEEKREEKEEKKKEEKEKENRKEKEKREEENEGGIEIEECIIGDHVPYHEAMIGTALAMCVELKAKQFTIVKTTRYDMREWINYHSALFRPYLPFIKWVEPLNSRKAPSTDDYNVWDYLLESQTKGMSSKKKNNKRRLLIYTTYNGSGAMRYIRNNKVLDIPTILMNHNPELTLTLPNVFNRPNVMVLLTSPHAYEWAKANWKWFNNSNVTINWRLPIFSEPAKEAVMENIFSSVGSNVDYTRDYPTLFNIFKGIRRDYDLRVFTKAEISDSLRRGVKATVLTGEPLTSPAPLPFPLEEISPRSVMNQPLTDQKLSWKYAKLYSFITDSKFTISFTPKSTKRYYENAISSALVEGVSLGVPVLCTEPSHSAFCRYFPDFTLAAYNSTDLMRYMDMSMSEYLSFREAFLRARDHHTDVALRATLN